MYLLLRWSLLFIRAIIEGIKLSGWQIVCVESLTKAAKARIEICNDTPEFKTTKLRKGDADSLHTNTRKYIL